MKYLSLSSMTISDGPGCRVSLYVSGCRNKCPHCHNPRSWDFNCGTEFATETIEQIVNYLEPNHIQGITICGGEPFEEENQVELVRLIRRIKMDYPQKDIWMFSGYEFSDLLKGGKKNTSVTVEILSNIDVLVVGPYIHSQRDISDANRWRGSRNQRVIDVQASLANNKLVGLSGIPNNEV